MTGGEEQKKDKDKTLFQNKHSMDGTFTGSEPT
jgi:hypothetical protein